MREKCGLSLQSSPHIVTTRQVCADRHLTGEGMTQLDGDHDGGGGGGGDDDDDDDDN